MFLFREVGAAIPLTISSGGYGSPRSRGGDIADKNGRDFSRPFSTLRCVGRYLGGAMPGGGGGSDATPPLSSGVMRRMVTRRLIALGPSVCSFRYCLP